METHPNENRVKIKAKTISKNEVSTAKLRKKDNTQNTAPENNGSRKLKTKRSSCQDAKRNKLPTTIWIGIKTPNHRAREKEGNGHKKKIHKNGPRITHGKPVFRGLRKTAGKILNLQSSLNYRILAQRGKTRHEQTHDTTAHGTIQKWYR